MSTQATQNDIEQIEAFLKREARGIIEVSARTDDGRPASIKVTPVVDKVPFPTIYWLVDPVVYKAISQIEGQGFTKELQAMIDNDEELKEKVKAIHESYRDERVKLFKEMNLELPDNMMPMITDTGIGGLRDFYHLRCLHMFYAFHLVRPHAIGELVDKKLQQV
ncbi:PF04417 family protein [Bacteriovorax sp. BAL6_X]|uniref:DUF501 domain-containing protein n=1 Tax=Bacteriovorax sp. BAL6_X TaxID=1201290 RepID=UPI000386A0D7|nr:DUF501 domain-containing protein [Bacteriovorax sp. BAL6_X]EPZ51810.1 PF04417 family protein [Bacteriovorax sp. BAL6_X]